MRLSLLVAHCMVIAALACDQRRACRRAAKRRHGRADNAGQRRSNDTVRESHVHRRRTFRMERRPQLRRRFRRRASARSRHRTGTRWQSLRRRVARRAAQRVGFDDVARRQPLRRTVRRRRAQRRGSVPECRRAATRAVGRTMCHKAKGDSTTSTVRATTDNGSPVVATVSAPIAAPTDRTTKAIGSTTCRTDTVDSSSPTTTPTKVRGTKANGPAMARCRLVARSATKARGWRTCARDSGAKCGPMAANTPVSGTRDQRDGRRHTCACPTARSTTVIWEDNSPVGEGTRVSAEGIKIVGAWDGDFVTSGHRRTARRRALPRQVVRLATQDASIPRSWPGWSASQRQGNLDAALLLGQAYRFFLSPAPDRDNGDPLVRPCGRRRAGRGAVPTRRDPVRGIRNTSARSGTADDSRRSRGTEPRTRGSACSFSSARTSRKITRVRNISTKWQRRRAISPRATISRGCSQRVRARSCATAVAP